jgi:hypothetical protein
MAEAQRVRWVERGSDAQKSVPAGSGLLASGFLQKPGPFFSDRLVLAFNGVAVTVWFLIGLAFAALPTCI